MSYNPWDHKESDITEGLTHTQKKKFLKKNKNTKKKKNRKSLTKRKNNNNKKIMIYCDVFKQSSCIHQMGLG